VKRPPLGVGGPRARADLEAAEERRQLLAELRANGVEYVERDGQTFTVLRLPDQLRAAPPATRVPVRLRARAFARA
jgi:hypothetical protein